LSRNCRSPLKRARGGGGADAIAGLGLFGHFSRIAQSAHPSARCHRSRIAFPVTHYALMHSKP
jgi:selenophosphate synthase